MLVGEGTWQLSLDLTLECAKRGCFGPGCQMMSERVARDISAEVSCDGLI